MGNGYQDMPPPPAPAASKRPVSKNTQPHQVSTQAPQHHPAAPQYGIRSQLPPPQHRDEAARHRNSRPQHISKMPNTSAESTRPPSVATTIKPPVLSNKLPDVSLAAAPSSHTPDKLSKIPYEDLHAQSLSDDEVEHSEVLDEEAASKPLSEQLAMVQKLDADQQQKFMASISIGQWEEAGDWFLDRFANVVNRMKDARKERRKLAKAFGDEMLARHNQVAKKKRAIEDALDDMTKSGMSVLKAGTPKKKKVRV